MLNRLRKVEVIRGVYWIEVPEVDLYILCGCPADAVKHLMQRGLITTVERDGVSFETGPNVILLSDVMVQSGHFSSLGEFPVLQMLYRQGMILPGHPNNSGIKPMIIGAEVQIKAQLDYIYRGNYGLINREEIEATGVSAQMADEIMRMKYRFAFGAIRPSSELLDSLVVTDEPREIRSGVMVQRLATNRFVFSFAGETAEVDLNLGHNQQYRSPYPLGFFNIRREYFAVIHSGQGDGWDLNRPSMSSIIMYQGRIYLVDAGPNLSYCLTALGISVNEIEGIFQTHSHDDHFCGLTTLMRTDRKVKFFATALVRSSVFKKLAALLRIDEASFEHYFDIQDLQFDRWNDVDGLEVLPFLSPHPVETSIFTFRTFWDGEYLSFGHYADIVSMQMLDSLRSTPEKDDGISEEYYKQVKAAYFSPLNLKKLDVGGGMIHGVTEDFAKDESERIILAHTAIPLDNRQKEIGSSAPFGIVDILISDNSDAARRIAMNFVEDYFPDVPHRQFQILINSEIVTLKPGTIFLKQGAVNQEIYLLLTGNVEMINSAKGIYNMLSSGEIVGEHSGLHQYPARATYRSVSYVRALRIPYMVYLRFVKQNRLYTRIERLHENREFLQGTWLFGESVTYPTQNLISKGMKQKIFYSAGESISDETASSLYLVESGKIEHRLADRTFEYETGNFFGAEALALGQESPAPGEIVTTEPASLYIIPESLFSEIPIVRWKLFETYRKRSAAR